MKQKLQVFKGQDAKEEDILGSTGKRKDESLRAAQWERNTGTKPNERSKEVQ